MGTRRLMQCGATVVVFDEANRVLMLRRTDNGCCLLDPGFHRCLSNRAYPFSCVNRLYGIRTKVGDMRALVQLCYDGTLDPIQAMTRGIPLAMQQNARGTPG